MKKVINFVRGVGQMAGAYGAARKAVMKIHCNICEKKFKAKSRFERFCRACKQSDESYRFAGWLGGGTLAGQ